MEKFTSLKINETSVMPDVNMGEWTAKAGPVPQYALGAVPPEEDAAGKPTVIDSVEGLDKPEIGEITTSEPAKFVSKIFESREMAHLYHLQATGEGAYSAHKALNEYYDGILELNDTLIETYQGQYDIVEDYDLLTFGRSSVIDYFINLAQFIKDTRYKAFLQEDTHLHNIIDEMVALVYRTLYKLKNLK